MSEQRCERCLKRPYLCVCAITPRVANRTRVAILQHPRERSHPLGSARLASLGLCNSELFVWGPLEVDAAERLEGFHRRLPARTALLYPSATSQSLDDLPPEQLPDCILAIDGTWHHARTLYRDAPWMHHLQHVHIAPSQPSRFSTLRREPLPNCTSTLEAIVEALTIVEPQTPELDRLLAAFEHLIARQRQFTSRRSNPRRKERPESPVG